MRRRGSFSTSLAALVAAAAALRAAPAAGGRMQQSFTGDGVKATVSIPGETMPRFGFIPLRITTENTQARELRWEASFASTWFAGNSSGAAQTTVPVIVPPGRGTERWIFVPTADAGLMRPGGYFSGYGNFNATFDGPAIKETILRFNAGAPGRGNNMVPWAVSLSLESGVRTRIAALKTPPSGSTYVPPGRPAPPPPPPRPLVGGALNLTGFDPAQPLDDWRAWTPFARVVMRGDEYATMPPANRAALHGWVALGGALYLEPDAVRATRGSKRMGAGVIETLAAPIGGEGPDGNGKFFSASLLLNTSPALPFAGELNLQKGTIADRVSAERGVGDWLVYFFVGFAILVGPVNLFAIAPVRRRQWVFVSVPAISLTAVAILVAAIFLQDGVGGEGARRALVVLLPGENQAAVFQDQISRTGLLFGSDFPLADDTVCTAMPSDDPNFTAGRPLEYNRRDGKASGDWFRGRARQAQHLRRLTPTRARIEQVGTAADGAPIVQSSIGTTLRNFGYVDAQRVAWRVSTLPSGQRVTLMRSAGDGGRGAVARRFSAPGSVHFKELVRSTAQSPEDGRFVALADDFDLAPLRTLDAISWDESAVLVTGMMEVPGTASTR